MSAAAMDTNRIINATPTDIGNASFEVFPSDGGQWEVYAFWPGTDHETGYDGSGTGATIAEAMAAAVADMED